jgi:tetratricopeptide (TPR) repeat protein
VRRHRAAVIVASALTAALVVAVATGFVAVRRQARIAEAERDRARLAARKAEETNAFVVGMLKSADPRVAGRDVTVASVLDAASGRVEEELAGQPDVKAEVLTTLGTTYQGLGLYEPAKERLRAALDASRGAVGPEHIEVALALGRLAGAFEDEGDLRQAERLGREALARCTRSPTCCGPRATTRERRASGVTSSRSAVACFRTRTRWSPAPCRSWA